MSDIRTIMQSRARDRLSYDRQTESDGREFDDAIKTQGRLHKSGRKDRMLTCAV